MLAEEFLRAGIDFDFSKCRLIDAQTIFHKMERHVIPFSCLQILLWQKNGRGFQAHRADQDTEATYRVLMGNWINTIQKLPRNPIVPLLTMLTCWRRYPKQ